MVDKNIDINDIYLEIKPSLWFVLRKAKRIIIFFLLIIAINISMLIYKVNIALNNHVSIIQSSISPFTLLLIIIPLFFIFLIPYLIKRYFIKYKIDPNCIVLQYGVLNKHSNTIPYDTIVMTNVSQTFFERILRVGTIKLSLATYSDTLNTETMYCVKNIKFLSDLINRLSINNRQH